MQLLITSHTEYFIRGSNPIHIWDYVLRKKINRFIEPSHNIFLQTVRDFINVCPKCKKTNISRRQRKTPKYHCQDCKNEFDNPKAEIVYITQKQRKEIGKQYSNPDF